MKKKTKAKIKEFTDLETWQEGHKLVLMIYEVTAQFPEKEKFGLISQMQRAAVSMTSNVAEGFGRQSCKEKVHFYYQADGSLCELKNQIIVARDIGYIEEAVYERLMNQANSAHRLLKGLTRKTKERI